MAELFRAKLTGAQGFEKLIAIKKILPHLSAEGQLVRSFIDEAKLAALLNHENIVQIYDFGSMEGEYFIAMEYLFGKDLRTVTNKARKRNMLPGLENTLYLVSQICAGLEYSHRLKDLKGEPLNIIHRDINPQNIFITYQGQVKIIDFGIAKAASHNTTTHEGLIKGKLAYMSPEQANGKTIDHRSDIFSTGIILYELLADKKMFEGEALQIYSQVREAEFEAPEKVISDIPPKLYEVLHRALAKNMEDRYQSCGEMFSDLEACIHQLSSRPNAQTIARYLKALFEEEFAAEELTLWAKTQIFSTAETNSDKDPSTETRRYGETVVLPSTAITRKQRPGLWNMSLIFIMIILGVWSTLDGTKTPLPIFARDISAHSDQTRPAASARKDERIAAGKAAVDARQYALAIDIFEEILASEPSKVESIAEDYIQALRGEAANFVNVDRQKATALLDKVLEIDPHNKAGLSQLGFIYVSQKDYSRAADVYQRVVALDPDFAGAYFNLGYIYWATEDYLKSKEMYQRAIDLNPEFLDEALFNLAMVHARLGEQAQCLKKLEQALNVNPQNESAKTYLQQLKGGLKTNHAG